MKRSKFTKPIHEVKEIELFSLASLIGMGVERGEIDDLFHEFQCKREPDVIRFLREKAVEYELSGKTETFLYLETDEEARQGLIDDRSLRGCRLAGYFAIADAHDVADDGRDGVLIAQVSRDDRWVSRRTSVSSGYAYFDGEQMLQDAEHMAHERWREAAEQTAGEHSFVIVYLDCKGKGKLYRRYRRHGYLPIDDMSYGPYQKMFKKIRA